MTQSEFVGAYLQGARDVSVIVTMFYVIKHGDIVGIIVSAVLAVLIVLNCVCEYRHCS